MNRNLVGLLIAQSYAGKLESDPVLSASKVMYFSLITLPLGLYSFYFCNQAVPEKRGEVQRKEALVPGA